MLTRIRTNFIQERYQNGVEILRTTACSGQLIGDAFQQCMDGIYYSLFDLLLSQRKT